MPFHRFEDYDSVTLTPHLSSGKSPIIEGDYLYFCLNQKDAGTGSELHYHPNELLIFMVSGRANGVVGKDRRIIAPGTFVLVPPNVRHSFKATEDGPSAYLYIKDRTWTVVGLAADEERPDHAMQVDEANSRFESGEITDRKGTITASNGSSQPSEIIIDGVPDCYYPVLDGLDQSYGPGKREDWIEGERSAFGFFEVPSGHQIAADAAEHEYFYYVLDGNLDATVGGTTRRVEAGGIIEVPKGESYQIAVSGDCPTRFVAVRSCAFLENRIDNNTD